jgi:hypothetical protein
VLSSEGQNGGSGFVVASMERACAHGAESEGEGGERVRERMSEQKRGGASSRPPKYMSTGRGSVHTREGAESVGHNQILKPIQYGSKNRLKLLTFSSSISETD